MNKYNYEQTDTFAGESNYSWVKRGQVKAKSMLGAVRKVKKQLGLNGAKCSKQDFGDMVALRPQGFCQVVFINSAE